MLILVKEEFVEEFVKDMKLNGVIEVKIIGFVVLKGEKYIIVL